MSRRRLLLLRHAKSSWDDDSLPDHERPLNKRGRRDAPRVGDWLKKTDRVPQCILSSTARRARKTARIAAEHCGFDGRLLLLPELYLAAPGDFLNVLATVPDTIRTVLLVGHNPGMEDFASEICGQSLVMPTAALADIDLGDLAWKELSLEPRGRLIELWTPRG
jgi:phosphohistidine phosphatase